MSNDEVNDMYELIEKLANVYGATGREGRVADTIRELVKDSVDSVETDVMGNLICIKNGKAGGRRVMLSAHMDHIGFIVVAAEKEGFLRVMPVGGVPVDQAAKRHVYFENGVHGVMSAQPLKEGEKLAAKHLYIDIGADSAEEALGMVSIGDIAVWTNDCHRLGAHRVASPAMDDRCACALLVKLLQTVKKPKDTLVAVFSTQEEVGCRGARTASYALDPDVGIALDVTANGDTPETKFPAVMLGKGAAIKIMDRGSISNPDVVKGLLKAGEDAGVPTQREVLPFGGTDASAMQFAKGGVPVGTVSIPCRNVHSVCEIIDLRDMDAALKLLQQYVK